MSGRYVKDLPEVFTQSTRYLEVLCVQHRPTNPHPLLHDLISTKPTRYPHSSPSSAGNRRKLRQPPYSLFPIPSTTSLHPTAPTKTSTSNLHQPTNHRHISTYIHNPPPLTPARASPRTHPPSPGPPRRNLAARRPNPTPYPTSYAP